MWMISVLVVVCVRVVLNGGSFFLGRLQCLCFR